ncbi:hypothetical protein BU23DRAFT_483155, partial [Bimuria novae-zelandiae CBS 107.79]
TYDHRRLRTRLPVRSAIYKQSTGGSVVKWVTISESPLLYVFVDLSADNFASGVGWRSEPHVAGAHGVYANLFLVLLPALLP